MNAQLFTSVVRYDVANSRSRRLESKPQTGLALFLFRCLSMFPAKSVLSQFISCFRSPLIRVDRDLVATSDMFFRGQPFKVICSVIRAVLIDVMDMLGFWRLNKPAGCHHPVKEMTTSDITRHTQVCRDAQDAKRDIQVAVSPSLVTTAYYAPAALRPCRFATPSHARCRLRSTPANGLTACRMRLPMPFAGSGPIGPKPLRPYARADAFRGLRALASLSMGRSG